MSRAAPLDRPKKVPTQLYFIRAEGEPQFIKIGVANNVRSRMSKMQMDCPYRLRLLKRCPTPDLERSLHAKFADHRITGEWFHSVPELLALIEAMDGETTLEVRSYGTPGNWGSMVYPPSQCIDHLFIDKRDRAAIDALRVPAFKAPDLAGVADDPFELIA